MARKLSKTTLRILERPYSVRTPKGETLYFRDQSEAHAVSRCLRGVYCVFLIAARAWVPVGIID